MVSDSLRPSLANLSSDGEDYLDKDDDSSSPSSYSSTPMLARRLTMVDELEMKLGKKPMQKKKKKRREGKSGGTPSSDP